MRSVAVVVLVVPVATCIIPDYDIYAEGQFANRHAVRIVERVQLTDAAHLACKDEDPRIERCPQAPETFARGGHFLDPATNKDYDFCSCDKDSLLRDTRALRNFSLYAEDGDLEDDGTPLDSLYGAFMLDPRAGAPPTDSVAYLAYLDPKAPALDALPSPYDEAIGRPFPALREFTVGDENGEVDLCNGNAGDELAHGWHTLQFIVTDRPWFTPVVRDSDGNVVVDENGDPELAPQQVGVPDLAGAATYDVTSYTFYCSHWTEAEAQCQDQCDAPEGD
jgi:hypothetical protein